MHGVLAVVFVQSCSALLPPPRVEIEWFRDGRPYARDIPIRSTRNERVYRRLHERGAAAERTLSCTSVDGVSYFNDRVGSGARVRIPVGLPQGASRVVDRATVRRIEPPAGGSARTLWFSVGNPGISVYGLEQSAGVVEIRTPSPSGGVSVLRAALRTPTVAGRAAAIADSQRRVLTQRIGELERTVQTLNDSIRTLQLRVSTASETAAVAYSSSDVAEFSDVDAYVERGEFDEALGLLMRLRARLIAWSDSAGTRHRALDPLYDRLVDVLRRCTAAREARSARRRVPVCAL